MAGTDNNYATPSNDRSVTSYPARRGFKQGPIDPALHGVVGLEPPPGGGRSWVLNGVRVPMESTTA